MKEIPIRTVPRPFAARIYSDKAGIPWRRDENTETLSKNVEPLENEIRESRRWTVGLYSWRIYARNGSYVLTLGTRHVLHSFFSFFFLFCFSSVRPPVTPEHGRLHWNGNPLFPPYICPLNNVLNGELEWNIPADFRFLFRARRRSRVAIKPQLYCAFSKGPQNFNQREWFSMMTRRTVRTCTLMYNCKAAFTSRLGY